MNKRNRRIAIEVIVGIWLIVALYFFWPRGRVELDSGQRLVMGTFARAVAVTVDSETARQCVEAAFTEIRKVDELMSDYRADSQVSEVNRNGFRRAVKVSKPTYEVLQKAVEFSMLSGGAFDITVGPLVDIWRSAAEANAVPADAELLQARSKVGCELLYLDDNEKTVRFAVEGMRIDLGGIAKGYAVDRAIEAMQSRGAIGGMVDLGGDIRCFGAPPPGKDYWLIGLQEPNLGTSDPWPVARDKSLLVLKLTNAAIATSGDYRRFASIKGKRYSHIIDAGTGCSSDELTSVTIIAKKAVDADALATAVSVMGAEKGLALIEKIPQTEAILIPAFTAMTSQPVYELMKTSGAEKFIIDYRKEHSK